MRSQLAIKQLVETFRMTRRMGSLEGELSKRIRNIRRTQLLKRWQEAAVTAHKVRKMTAIVQKVLWRNEAMPSIRLMMMASMVCSLAENSLTKRTWMAWRDSTLVSQGQLATKVEAASHKIKTMRLYQVITDIRLNLELSREQRRKDEISGK